MRFETNISSHRMLRGKPNRNQKCSDGEAERKTRQAKRDKLLDFLRDDSIVTSTFFGEHFKTFSIGMLSV